MLKNNLSLKRFVLIISIVNLFLFHFPFYKFVFNNIEFKSFNGFIVITSLILIMFLVNAFLFYIIFFLSRYVGKIFLIITFFINALAVYFINTYGVIIDESMIGNILNTNYQESSSFFSFKLILYVILLGLLPSIFIFKAKIAKEKPKRFFINSLIGLLFIALLAFLNSSNWLWIDKNSKSLGGLAMPWSYSVNLSLFYKHKLQKNEKEIPLPNCTITDSTKSVVILVIGESARSQNFSLYGYNKNTNPLLSKTDNLFHFNSTSCATYTTAGVKCILSAENTSDLYEILPNYLYRNNVEVIWKTTNTGEPPIHIKNYQNQDFLQQNCKTDNCYYDEILTIDLKDQILKSTKNKILIILHTSTSHGPSYSKKYPPQFEIYKPVCNSVELANCSQTELINAYDNTIVYTDYLLSKIINDLKELKDYKSAMIFVSDHGESLGEKNLYMHGLPLSIAPKEQYDIPFIVWASNNSIKIDSAKNVSQNFVFHSVLNFLSIKSPVYKEEMSFFK